MNHVHLRKPRTTTKDRQRLVGKHCGQFLANPPGPELVGLTALTFEPASQTPSLLEQTLRPLGSTIMIVAQYQKHPYKPSRVSMPICGMYATAAADGSVSYGGKGRFVFARDAAIRSRPSRHGRAIDYLHEASLLETSMRMDAACRWKVTRRRRLPSLPVLPRILLGFAPFEVPPFEDTVALRQLAAKQLGVPIEKLGANGEMLLDRLLRDVWQGQLVMPDNPKNLTGLVLVDAELCTHARCSLVIFEDFSDLCGDRSWNPARTMKLPTVDNPAATLLRRCGVEANRGFDQMTGEQVERLELEMRQALGEGFEQVDQHLIFDALTNPGQEVVDYAAAVRLLRQRLLPGLADCVGDAELIQAAREPQQPLVTRGRCRVQVFASKSFADGYTLSEIELGRRASVDVGNRAAEKGAMCAPVS